MDNRVTLTDGSVLEAKLSFFTLLRANEVVKREEEIINLLNGETGRKKTALEAIYILSASCRHDITLEKALKLIPEDEKELEKLASIAEVFAEKLKKYKKER